MPSNSKTRAGLGSPLLVIRGCRAVLEDAVLEDASIVVERGLIRDVIQGSVARLPSRARTFDAAHALVGPGFIDPHCHGDGHRSFFLEPSRVAATLAAQGTTGVLATMGYDMMSPGGIVAHLARFRRELGGIGAPAVLGVHLEGPFTNRKYGAQTDRGMIKDFDPAEYGPILAGWSDFVRWWTCAPELPGAAAFIAEATRRHAVVAIGHSEATVEEVHAAALRGAKVATHWSNATGNPVAAKKIHAGTRQPGIDEAVLADDGWSAEIIPDERGLHVHPLMAKILYRAKGPDRILVVTDASYLPPGDRAQDLAQYPDVLVGQAGVLNGSRLTMPKAAANFRRFTGCTLPELFRMAALNAARLLGLDHAMGSIAVGKRANLVVLSDDFSVQRTLLGGVWIPGLSLRSAEKKRRPAEAGRRD